MAQQQTQSSSSQSQSQSQRQSRSQGPSLSQPAAPDATSPYGGPGQAAPSEKRRHHVADEDGPAEMEQPHFSEAQSTMGAYEPVERPGDHFAQPEDPLPATLATRPTEQSDGASEPVSGAEFTTSAGTLRAGMSVIDSYGHVIGIISSVDGEQMRLASADPHDDSHAFLPVSLIDGIDGNRILLGGRGDASFGMSGE